MDMNERIARINEKMWSELFLANRDALLNEMKDFETAFARLKKTIEDGDSDGMREIMRRSSEQRELFDKKDI